MYFDNLTKDHILDTEQVNKLLDIHTPNGLNYDNMWTKNLINNGYEFTGEQNLVLIKRKYEFNIDDFINKKNATIDDLYVICSLNNTTAKDISDFCTKHKIVPNNKCLEYILNNKKLQHTKDMIVRIFIIHKYKPNSFTMTDIINKQLYCSIFPDKSISTIQILVDNGAVITIDNFKHLLVLMDKHNHNNMWKYLKNYIDKWINNKIIITNDLLYLLIGIHDAYPNDVTGYKTQVYEIFFNKNTVITPELCDYVCKKANKYVFQLLVINNRFIPTVNSFPSCDTYSEYIFENLVNMKLTPDIECFKRCLKGTIYCSLDIKNMVELFASTGMEITYEIIDMLYQKHYVIDIEQYNLKYDDNIYYIMHKKGICINKKSAYYKKQNQKLMKFREYFKSKRCVEEIKKHITKSGIIPDMYCYDNACAYSINNGGVVEWLEKTYGFKPTSITMSRINNNNRRYYLLNRYFLDDAKHHKLTNIKDLYVLPKAHIYKNIIVDDNGKELEPDTTMKKSTKKKIIDEK